MKIYLVCFATWKARKPRVMTNRKFVINLQNDLSTLWTSIWTWLGVARWLSLLFLYSVYLLISDLIFTPASFLVLDVLQLLMLKTLQTQRGDCSSKFLKTLFFLQQSFINSSYSIVSWAKRTRRSWIKCRHMDGHVAESFVLGKTHHLIFSWVSLAIIRRRQLCSILQFSLPIISGSFVKVRAKREDSHLICAKM